MTPFAQLGERELEKDAFLKGVSKLVRHGVWKNVGAQARRSRLKAFSTGAKAPMWTQPAIGASKIMGGKVGKGLMGYGLAGLVGDVTGKFDLPGSHLAFNTTMPGLGALFSAPGLITAARMSSHKNQDKLREDVFAGARAAGGDLMSLTNTDSRFATRPNFYSNYMQQLKGPNMQELKDKMNQYSSGNYKPLSGWRSAQSLFSDSQDLINDRVDRQIHQSLAGPPIPNWMRKAGSEKEAALKAIGAGAKKVFPWLFPAMGVGAVTHSALRDKPYDPAQATQRGYAAAQVKLQKKLNGLGTFERLALRIDPSLMANRLEKHLPGTISQWERSTGNKHQPGWLNNTMSAWKKGGKPQYYEYDAGGQRHYI